jgi:hypothetical protein
MKYHATCAPIVDEIHTTTANRTHTCDRCGGRINVGDTIVWLAPPDDDRDDERKSESVRASAPEHSHERRSSQYDWRALLFWLVGFPMAIGLFFGAAVRSFTHGCHSANDDSNSPHRLSDRPLARGETADGWTLIVDDTSAPSNRRWIVGFISREQCTTSGIALSSDVVQGERTITPFDCGHNCRRKAQLQERPFADVLICEEVCTIQSDYGRKDPTVNCHY